MERVQLLQAFSERASDQGRHRQAIIRLQIQIGLCVQEALEAIIGYIASTRVVDRQSRASEGKDAIRDRSILDDGKREVLNDLGCVEADIANIRLAMAKLYDVALRAVWDDLISRQEEGLTPVFAEERVGEVVADVIVDLLASANSMEKKPRTRRWNSTGVTEAVGV